MCVAEWLPAIDFRAGGAMLLQILVVAPGKKSHHKGTKTPRKPKEQNRNQTENFFFVPSCLGGEKSLVSRWSISAELHKPPFCKHRQVLSRSKKSVKLIGGDDQWQARSEVRRS
jgi:hypothetical protein